MRPAVGLLAVFITVVVALFLCLTPASATNVDVDRQFVAVPVADDDAPVARPDHFIARHKGLPVLLSARLGRGELAVDNGGHLKVTRGVRTFFDHGLSAAGNLPPSVREQRLRADIRQRLSGMAAVEADQLLRGYIAYQRQLATLSVERRKGGEPIDIAAARRQMLSLQLLRMRYLSPEAIEAFFAEEDAYQRYTLNRLEILREQGLTTEARVRLLADAGRRELLVQRESTEVTGRDRGQARLMAGDAGLD